MSSKLQSPAQIDVLSGHKILRESPDLLEHVPAYG
jgi:hypothetical protein